MVATSRNVHTNTCAFNADHPSTTNSTAQGVQTKQWGRSIGTKNFFVPQLQHKLGSRNAHSPNDSNSSIPPFHHHASKEPIGRIELIAQETTHTPSDSNGNINHQLSRISKQYGTIDHGDLYLRDRDCSHHTPLKDVSVTPMLHVEPDDNSSCQGSQQDEVLDDEEYYRYITTEPHTPSEAAKEYPYTKDL